MATATPVLQRHEEWIPALEATRILGIGERELQRKAKRYPKQLTRKTQRMGPQRQMTALYLRSDLVAFRDRTKQGIDPASFERLTPEEDTAAPPPPPAEDNVALAPLGRPDALTRLAELLARLSAHYQPQPKVWMTIREASEYSGLPKGYLLGQCKLRKLGTDVGKRKGGRYRISKKELEAL
jgi:hypothetical protein